MKRTQRKYSEEKIEKEIIGILYADKFSWGYGDVTVIKENNGKESEDDD